MALYKNHAVNTAIVGIYTLLLTVFILTALYFGQNILIPITVSVLITFLLAPVVNRLERYMGRIAAVTTTVGFVFIIMSAIGYVLTVEFIDLTSKLPKYQDNIQIKLETLRVTNQGAQAQIWETLQNLQNKFRDTPPFKTSQPIQSTVMVPQAKVVPVKMVEQTSITQTAQIVLSPLFNVLWNTGLIMLLVIFMLLNKEDLKARIIRVLGEGQIGMTTQAMTDAGTRVSHYLVMQLLINISFGILLTFGLYFIGIPNAQLWGGLLAILRFIPYVGTWIAAIIPIILSFIISDSWITPVYTILLYAILDLISSNFVEPLLYGASTGVSSTALIIAVVFWTLLWGPIGLLLAVPLTVCLVVIGRHVPRFKFFSILLSDETPLALHEEFYHRLLTEPAADAMPLAQDYLKNDSLVSLYDNVMIPLLMNIAKDAKTETLDHEKAHELFESLDEIIEEINSTELAPSSELKTNLKEFIICLPSQHKEDEISAVMLSRLLENLSANVKILPLKLNFVKVTDFLAKHPSEIVFICAVAPTSLFHLRTQIKNIKKTIPQIKIIVGLWGYPKKDKPMEEKIKSLGASHVFTSFTEVNAKFAAEETEIGSNLS